MFATTYPWSLKVWASFFFFLVCLVFSVLFVVVVVVLLIQSVYCPFQLSPIHTKAKKKKKKLNKLEIKYFFQIQQRTEVIGHTTPPRIGETDKSHHDLRARAQGRDPQGPSSRAGNLSCNWQSALSWWLSPSRPHTLVSFISRSHKPGYYSKHQRRISLCSQQREEKRNQSKMCCSPLLFLTRSALGRNYWTTA